MGIFNNLIIPQLMFMLYFQLGSIKPLFAKEKVSFNDFHSLKFSHLTIHRDQGTVFISAGNRLFTLSPDLEPYLEPLANVSTTWNPSNIFINYKDSELMACGGTDGYWCSPYSLKKHELIKSGERLFSNDRRNYTNAPTVAFITSNNLGHNVHVNSILLIAFSYCDDSQEDPPLMIKQLLQEKNSKFEVEFNSRGLGDSHIKYHNKHKVNYIYGFSSGKYSYILTIQRSSTATGSSHISKIIRICYTGDENTIFQGYTEIPIHCEFHDGQAYNLVQTASLGKPNHHLAESMNITDDEDVLFGVFTKHQSEKVLHNRLNNQSALCIYSLKDINRKFDENIQNCFKGNGYREFDTKKLCTKSDQNLTSTFCSSDKIMPLVGSMSVSGSPTVTLDSFPTAIAATRRENCNVIFVGTKAGELMKIVAQDINNGRLENVIPIDKGSPVNSDLLFSPSNSFLYVMTERYLTRIDVSQSTICSNGCSRNYPIEFNSNISIASGKNASIAFPNSKSYICGTEISNLKCLISIEGKNYTKKIVMKNSDPFCENTTYTYVNNTSNINGTVAIVWNTPTQTNILSKTSVNIYKCQFMANNCPSCLAVNAEYKCRWCESSNTCEFQSNCNGRMIKQNTCPPPSTILSFLPLQGPWEGGTNVTIEGKSLGYTFEDINDIKVAEVPCILFKDKYIPQKSVTCAIKKSSTLHNLEGPVVIYVNKKRVTSGQHFRFLDPKILEISPPNGSIHGGTNLTIKGENLDAGKLIQVFIDNIQCSIFSNTSQEIKCVTKSSTEKEAWVNVKFDQNIRNFTNHTYKYVKDPENHRNVSPHIIPDVPPTISGVPPIVTEAPPITSKAPPVTSEAPPTTTEAPPTTSEAPPTMSDVSEIIQNVLQNTSSTSKIIICVFIGCVIFPIAALIFYLSFRKRPMKKLPNLNQKSQHQENEMDMKALATKQSMDETCFY